MRAASEALKWMAALCLTMIVSIHARPVRVAFLKLGPNAEIGHSSTHNGTPYFEAMLRSPGPTALTGNASLINDTLGTGASPIIPVDGFQVDTIGNGTVVPTTANIAKFLALLDSVDVLVMVNTMGFGAVLSTETDRAKFLHFADTRGIVALHASIDNHSSSTNAPVWSSYDSLCGVLFKDHATHVVDMLRDSLPFNTGDSDFTRLNSGLLPKYRFVEELYSVAPNPRTVTGMHVLYTLDENTYTPSTRMGDHPFAWYRRALSGHGGRYFYTSEGHTDSLYQKNYSFRRQIYNAIVWASRYDSASGTVAVRGAAGPHENPVLFSSSASGSALTVSTLAEGPHSVEIQTLDGAMISFEKGVGRRNHVFHVPANAVYAVSVKTPGSRQARLVIVP